MDRRRAWWLLAFACFFGIGSVEPVRAQSLSLYGIHMDPYDQDARDFSRASYGGGLQGSFPVPGLGNLVAGSVGLELVNMLSETHVFQDQVTGFRIEQQTSQDYFRFYLGPELGPQGNGFFRPHVGAHLAVVNHGISVDIVVPDDTNRENELRQSVSSKNRASFGYDLNAGTDLNFGQWFVTGGARYARSFNVPKQLGGEAVKIHPGYFQIYAGLGVNLRRVKI
jgi:hypothetical protein